MKKWQFNRDDWREYSGNLLERISQISDYVTRRDLYKLHTSLEILVTKIIREEVRCNRLQRQSHAHIKLIEEYEASIQNFIEQMTFGLLCL